MKNAFLFLCCLFSAALFAQTKTQIVTGIETDDSFSFKVRFDDSRNDDLVRAYLKVVNDGKETPVKITRFEGKSSTTTADGTVVELNTKRSSLRIRSAKDNKASRMEAEQYAGIVREELGLEAPEPPAAPAPPTRH